jgi:predicted DNA-binding WGR domain protein
MRSSIVVVQRDQVTHRWINPRNQRYYTVRLEQDLLGDWTLIACWGGLNSHRGAMKVTCVENQNAGQQAIMKIAKHRRQRGYDELTQDDRPCDT